MLKNTGEPGAPWRCSVKYVPKAWNCGVPNRGTFRALDIYVLLHHLKTRT